MSVKTCKPVIDEYPWSQTLIVRSLRNVPGIASASLMGTWGFRKAKRGALLHTPQQKFLPKLVQTKILDAKHLEGKKVVTTALTCPAYLLYLSDKCNYLVRSPAGRYSLGPLHPANVSP